MRSIALALAAACAALSFATHAQEPPSRAGRISVMEGPVSVFQDRDAGWEEGFVNTPLTSENSVWTDAAARAEIEVSATAMRLAPSTQLDISRLEDALLDATVTQGTAIVRVRYKQRDERYLLSTPGASFEVLADGAYRLEYDAASGESRLTVRSGSARLEGDGGPVAIPAGRTALVIDGPSPSYAIEPAQASDDFERWSQSRDAAWRDSSASRYVSTYMTGYQDLDSYGEWASDADYGAVWYPTQVASDWAPYRDGRWDYVQPWGWTWVDAAPWGYAPFHYGRWVWVRNRWAWVPGRRIERPVWAPALVAWLGSTPGSARSPSVGWYPLAPWERYQPWYRAGGGAERVNFGVRDRPPQNVSSRGDEWRHWNRDRGATVVDRNALTGHRPVQQARVATNVQAIRQQPVVSGSQVAQVLPQRNELARARSDVHAPRVAPSVARGDRGAAPGRAGKAPPPAQAQQGQPGTVVQPRFRGRDNVAAKPAPAPAQAAAPGAAPAVNPLGRAPAPQQPTATQAFPNAIGGRQSEAQRQLQEQAQRQQQEAQARERQAREAQQQQERAQHDAQQQREGQQRQQQDAQRQQQEAQGRERQAREAQQQQERSQRDAQQQRQQQEAQQRQQQEAQQRQQQEAQQRQQQEAQQRQQQEAQQRQQQEAQARERQAREAQQQQERAQRDAQQQREAQQRQQQEAQQRQQQEAQQRQQQEVQRQQQQQQREAQQRQQQEAQQRQQQEAQQRQQQEAQQRQQQEALQRQQLQEAQRQQQQREAAQQREKEKEKEKDKDKDNKDDKPR